MVDGKSDDGVLINDNDNIEFLQTADDIKIVGVEDSYFAVVFAGPDSVAMKMTRRGVSTTMLGALVMKLKAMVEVEESMKHQAALQQAAQRAAMSSIAKPAGYREH